MKQKALQLLTAAKSIVFTILIPGTVAAYVPQWLARIYPQQIELGLFAYAGVVAMLLGFGIYTLCVLRFLLDGGGTPAIWFTKPISFLIGEEPNKLVIRGLYRFSRNPMYLGVVCFVLGEAIWFQKSILFLYAVGLWFCFHLVVVFLEEPHLKKRMGQDYTQFVSKVPRWIRVPKTARRQNSPPICL
jgi:protein-S-isoprenylcysteine O-methyltransferase Ste14